MAKTESEMKKTDWRLWAILTITLLGIAYNVFANVGIWQNELLHLKESIAEWKQQMQLGFDKIEQRLNRIEDDLWRP